MSQWAGFQWTLQSEPGGEVSRVCENHLFFMTQEQPVPPQRPRGDRALSASPHLLGQLDPCSVHGLHGLRLPRWERWVKGRRPDPSPVRDCSALVGNGSRAILTTSVVSGPNLCERGPSVPILPPLWSLSHLSCRLSLLLTGGILGKGQRGWGNKPFARLWGRSAFSSLVLQ